MKNGINNNKTFFVLTILFSLILNGIRAENNDEIKSLVQDQYSKTNISYIFSNVINKLPTLKDQIIGIQYLYKLMRENNDVKDSEKIFEFAQQIKQFGNRNLKEIKVSKLYINVTLPQCVETVVLNSRRICFDNEKYVLQTYAHPFYPKTKLYLYEGNCESKALPTMYTYWKVTSHKKNNIQDLQSLDLLRQLKNVKFELAPDGERCYVQVDGKYLTKDGESQYLALTDDKSPNGIWYVRSRF